jgi:hypothetical protein
LVITAAETVGHHNSKSCWSSQQWKLLVITTAEAHQHTPVPVKLLFSFVSMVFIILIMKLFGLQSYFS